MAAKSKKVMQNRSPKENNALKRVLNLPVVNSACNSLQKTYTTTKEAHPLMALVCGAYERCVRSAMSLAAWSVKPVEHQLGPQVAAVNVLACQGLDCLKQRIPALQKPVEKVTSDLKDSILTHIQSAMHSVMDTLNRVLGLPAKSYEQCKSIMKDTTEYIRSSRVSQVVEAGVDAAAGKLEKLVDVLHPNTEHKSAHEPPEKCVSKEVSQTSVFRKIRSFAAAVSQLAYRHISRAIQHTRDKGQGLAMWIPSLDGLAIQSTAKVLQALSGVLSTATSWLSNRQGKVPEKEEEAKEEDNVQASKQASREGREMKAAGSLAQRLHTASLATISSLKNAPFIPWNAAAQLLLFSPCEALSKAGAKVGMLGGNLRSIMGSLLTTTFHYVPLPKVLVEEERTASRSVAHSRPGQQLEGTHLIAAHPKESESTFLLQGERRLSRGHFPLPFINLDDPLLPQQTLEQCRGLAFEAEYLGPRKSAFSPYKDGAYSRRRSEGLFWPSPEVMYTRAHYTGLYSTTLKKD